MENKVHIELPFTPPSVNSIYYTDFRTGTRHKSKRYRDFIEEIFPYIAGMNRIRGLVDMEINVYWPDKRKRDVENILKPLNDALVYYGLIEDDSKVMRIVLEKYSGPSMTLIEIIPHRAKK